VSAVVKAWARGSGNNGAARVDSAAAAAHFRDGTPRGDTMLGNRTSEEWIAQYSTSHQHPFNRVCHTVGIPLIAISILLFVAAIFVAGLWKIALLLFVVGWVFQFIGHAFEGKAPEFFHDWRFLFVGLRWWFAKIRGRA
jgi:uncharacterized membrane protein YGL010W